MAQKTTGTYTPTEYNPVVEQVGGVSYRLHDLTQLMRFGMPQREAAEVRHMREYGNRERALRITRGYARGVDRAEFDAALGLDGYNTYLELRSAGTSHESALELAAKVHHHRFGKGEVLSDFCPVLRTGERAVRHTCECGHSETTSERRNYSGD